MTGSTHAAPGLQAKLDAEAKVAEAAGPGPLAPVSSSSTEHSRQLSSIPFVGIPSHLMQPGAALVHAWDLDPSEIAVCKRPDGSDWLLGTGSFGQVSTIQLLIPLSACRADLIYPVLHTGCF